MANTPKEVSKQVRYTNGNCSVMIYIDLENKKFEVNELSVLNYTSPEDIAELYKQAGIYAVQILRT